MKKAQIKKGGYYPPLKCKIKFSVRTLPFQLFGKAHLFKRQEPPKTARLT